jgi:hypothetical protein
MVIVVDAVDAVVAASAAAPAAASRPAARRGRRSLRIGSLRVRGRFKRRYSGRISNVLPGRVKPPSSSV